MHPFRATIRIEECVRMPRYKNWKAFTVKNQNTKQASGMQVTFILEIKHQEKHFFSEIWIFSY